MPEQITKYPEVTLQVLQGAGARCGEGIEQKILTQCPRERFCSLPTGEMCIYGIDQIGQMTQITGAELVGAVGPGDPPDGPGGSQPGAFDIALWSAIFVGGLLLGKLWRWKPRSKAGAS